MLPGDFVGRRDERAILRSLLDAVLVEHTPRACLLSGEPGAGKSTMITHFTQHVRAATVGVRSAAPAMVERGLPWSTMRLLVAGDEALPTPVAAATGHVDREAPVEAADVVYAFGRWLAGLGPVVVVVDDAQWVDTPSATAISNAMRLEVPVLWVIASRAGEPLAWDPARVIAPERTVELALGGLHPSELADLLMHVSGRRWNPVHVGQVAELTGGNPLFATEIATTIGPGGDLERARLPRSIDEIYADRLSTVPTEAIPVLAATGLAVAPTVDALRRLFGAATDQALDAAERAGLVIVHRGQIEFRHALARQALLDRLGGIERSQLHLRLADVARDAEVRAWHLAHAAFEPDEAVAGELELAAAAAASRGASARAAELYERAAALTPTSSTGARRLRTGAAGQAAVAAGDWERGERLLREAIADATGDELVELGAGLLVCIDRLDSYEAAAAFARDLLARHDVDLVAELRLLRTLVRLEQHHDLRAAADVAHGMLGLARRAGDDLELLGAELAWASTRFLLGDPVDLDELERRTRQLAPRPDGQSAPWFLTELLVWSDDERTCHWLDELDRVAQATGQVTEIANVLDQRIDVAFRRGRWVEAEELLGRLDELGDVHGVRSGVYAAAEPLRLAGVTGRWERVDELMARVGDELDLLPPIGRFQFEAYAGIAQLAAERWSAAAQHLGRCHSIAGRIGLEDARALGYHADLVEALVRTGDLAGAEQIASKLTVLAQRSGSGAVAADARRAHGLVLAAHGAHQAAAESFRTAIELDGTGRRPFPLARALLGLGSEQRRLRQRALARATLEHARTVFEDLGAVPWIAWTDDELARLGTRTAVSARPGELTPTEQRIADLVGAGRSNRQIADELVVSLRTVESNLTRIYRKLGVRTRTELALRRSAERDD